MGRKEEVWLVFAEQVPKRVVAAGPGVEEAVAWVRVAVVEQASVEQVALLAVDRGEARAWAIPGMAAEQEQ